MLTLLRLLAATALEFAVLCHGARLQKLDVLHETQLQENLSPSDDCWHTFLYAAANNNLEKDIVENFNDFTRLDGDLPQAAHAFIDRNNPSGRNKERKNAHDKLIVGAGHAPGGAYLSLQEDRRWKSEKELGPIDANEPDVLKDFLKWALPQSTCQRKFLILNSHGRGYEGFGDDDSHNTGEMPIDGIRKALERSLERGKKVDVLGFDACLMMDYSVASLLQPVTKYLLASEQIVPHHGWSYDTMDFSRGKSSSELGQGVVADYIDMAERGDSDMTLALLNMLKFAKFDNSLRMLMDVVSELSAPKANALRRARQNAASFEFDDEIDCRLTSSCYAVDLGSYLKALLKSAAPLGLHRPVAKTLEHYNGMFEAHKEFKAGPLTGMYSIFPPVSSSNGTKVMRKFRKYYGKKNEMKHWADFVDFMRGSDSTMQAKKILRKKKQKPSKVKAASESFAELAETKHPGANSVNISSQNGELVLTAAIPDDVLEVDLVYGSRVQLARTAVFLAHGSAPGLLDATGIFTSRWQSGRPVLVQNSAGVQSLVQIGRGFAGGTGSTTTPVSVPIWWYPPGGEPNCTTGRAGACPAVLQGEMDNANPDAPIDFSLHTERCGTDRHRVERYDGVFKARQRVFDLASKSWPAIDLKGAGAVAPGHRCFDWSKSTSRQLSLSFAQEVAHPTALMFTSRGAEEQETVIEIDLSRTSSVTDPEG